MAGGGTSELELEQEQPLRQRHLLKQFEQTGLVKLDASLHKGQCGRVMVVGGSKEYTGAPYYAGISALRAGSDLVHVMCTQDALVPLKSYSPELMVHGILPSSVSARPASDALDTAAALVRRMDALVVGPGLGRDPVTLDFVESLLVQVAQERHREERVLALVFDADGLGLLKYGSKLFKTQTEGILSGPVVLTPNVVEYARLVESWRAGVDTSESAPDPSGRLEPAQLASLWGSNLVIVEKGPHDMIASGDQTRPAPLLCAEPGSLRRCGGQGDVLAGVLTCFVAMQTKRLPDAKQCGPDKTTDWRLAAFAACTLVRKSSAAAFAKKYRSMLTTDLIECLPEELEALFPVSAE